MPKIQWTNLPEALRDHLFDRLRERKISPGARYARGYGWQAASPVCLAKVVRRSCVRSTRLAKADPSRLERPYDVLVMF